MPVSFDLAILYRGPLESCNYACTYCPFAKSVDSPADLAADADAVTRFVRWVGNERSRRLGIQFTPWGEALVRQHYRDAVVSLSHIDHVDKVAVQTNLSCRLEWLEHAERQKVGLWCTYHPSQVDRATFLAQCGRLDRLGVRYSVGVVGLKEHFDEIEALRDALSPEVYLWVNAYKRDPNYYQPADVTRLGEIDRLFSWNNQVHRSLGESCRAGEDAISVDGDGNVRRCHFVREIIGNLYEPGWEKALVPRRCPRDGCGCHIGYVHLDRLGLYDVYGDGLLERFPLASAMASAGSTARKSSQTV